LKKPTAVIVAPRVVYNAMSAALQGVTTVLTNGQSTNLLGIGIEAIPMYNITPGRLTYHVKGTGNGYVITLGGQRLYMCGDSEDVAEMRALTEIDVAFLCMNLPFTMTPEQAADATRVFRPRIVYPYHFSSSDVQLFKRRVGTDVGVEVRLRNWY
jgi:L-ascorbate metabolism protein UlaG (beta-lactamase superfamily)